MAKREPPRPTNAELEILRVLWQRGRSTVREIHESLRRAEPVGYTTILKLLQIMPENRLVTRDASARGRVYAAATSQATMLRRMISDLARRAFGGYTVSLVLHALATSPAPSRELDRIRSLLDEKKGGKA